MQSNPYEMKVVQANTLVNETMLSRVEQFARETGDLGSLSKVDKLVIAAGLGLAKQTEELDKVRDKPAELEEFRPNKMKEFYEDDLDEKPEE